MGLFVTTGTARLDTDADGDIFAVSENWELVWSVPVQPDYWWYAHQRERFIAAEAAGEKGDEQMFVFMCQTIGRWYWRQKRFAYCRVRKIS